MNVMIFCFMFLAHLVLVGQDFAIKSVSPDQDAIGASLNTQIIVELDSPIDSFSIPSFSLFRVYGSNSSLIEGYLETDTIKNKFIYTPRYNFFDGEIIDVSFGPLFFKDGGTSVRINWQFTTEISNPTAANFDSLKRFDYPSFYSMATDFDRDGDIDIVSATGRIAYNDGNGNFTSFEEREELWDVSFRKFKGL